ncbi:MAG TPA: lipopolysaccharide heptosyltransferase II [Desulfobacteraceae bacterium]|nr:lipopolysaccharide heptosyltransferase II [Desulfobacteraceae bacterium]
MEKHINTLIIFCPNWVGDVVMATPAFKLLRNSYPDAKIIGVIRKYASRIIEDSPWFDQIIDCSDKTVKGYYNLVKSIREHKPDMAVLFPNTFRAAGIAKLGGVKKIFGYKRNGRSFLLTGGPLPVIKNRKYMPVSMVEYYIKICTWLKLNPDTSLDPKLYFSDLIREKGEKLLKKYHISTEDTVIGINPGAKFGSSKCWSEEYFAKLAQLIDDEFNCKILLFAGPGEKKIAASIIKKSSAPIINTYPDQVDLAMLKPLVKRCDLLITNDTGPRHYAVAFNIPVVVIMGPTDPEYTNSNLEKTILLRKKLDCSPCHKGKCPLGHHNCMELITPESVLQAVKKSLFS